MNRPYVICHMLTTVDGKISGEFMEMPETTPVRQEAWTIRTGYTYQATLYGTTTMEESYAAGRAPALPPADSPYPRKDYVAFSDVNNYIVSLDTEGILGWEGKYIEKKGRPRAHVIEVLTEKVSDDYLAYLHRFDISYIFAGKETLDCALMLEKLKGLFGIETMVMAGGGGINGTFLHAGLIDELSLIIAPLADGGSGAVSLFERAPFLPPKSPAVFTLEEVRRLEGNGVWLRYKAK